MPGHIRCDNGPELVACALRRWCRETATATTYIEPGAPWQNPFCESFNSTARDELLDVELFANLAEAKLIVSEGRAAYNADHHHSALGMLTPGAFAARWQEQNGLEEEGGSGSLAGDDLRPADRRYGPHPPPTRPRIAGSGPAGARSAHATPRSARPPGSLHEASSPSATLKPDTRQPLSLRVDRRTGASHRMPGIRPLFTG